MADSELTDDEITIGRPAEAALIIGRVAEDGFGGARVAVRLRAPGVEALTAIELEAWSGGPSRLGAFFDDLAAGWKGWSGPKEWGDDAATFEMRATHDRKGLVVLHVTASNSPNDGPGRWSVEMDVPIEPGALEGIAHRVGRYLAKG